MLRFRYVKFLRDFPLNVAIEVELIASEVSDIN